jgi:hypothetical protein
LVLEGGRTHALTSPDSAGILVQVPDLAGWRTVRRYVPRRRHDEAAIDCAGASVVRLVFLGEVELRFAGPLVRSAERPSVRWASLESARHTRLGEVGPAVARVDASAAALEGPDTLGLVFSLAAPGEGQVREWFLAVGATLLAGRSAPSAGLGREAQVPPTHFALAQNQPNPFAVATTIRFALPVASAVRLEILDVQGRRVRMLRDGDFPAGHHAVDWDRGDAGGHRARPGVYLYRLQAGRFHAQRRLVVLGR